MKILFMIPSLGQGGAEKVLVNMVNHLDKNIFDITVQTLFDEGENKQFLNHDIKYRSFKKHQFRGNKDYFKLFTPKQLFRKIVKEDYDIIVSYLEGPTARIVSGCDNTNTRLISWIHGHQYSKKNAAASFRSYQEALKCYSKYDHIVCVSEGVKRDFVSLFTLNNSISVLNNVNETEQIIMRGKENIDFVIDEKCINLCAIGTLKKVKGFDRLIRITKKLVDDALNVKLYILGKGPLDKELRNMVEDLELIEHVIFLGYQVNPYKYISKMDMFVCASFSEGFSTAATEALILGVPVATVNVSGMKEMLGDNKYGIITENDEEKLYQGIKLLIEDRNKLNYYKRQASNRGAFFSTENTVRLIQDFFMSLL